MAAVFPLPAASPTIGEPEPTLDGLGATPRASTRRATTPSAGTARPSAPSTSPCTTSSARSSGIPVHELIGLPAAIPPTDFTLGIDEPAVVAERARRAAGFPALKIKVGGPQDLATLRAVRERLRRARSASTPTPAGPATTPSACSPSSIDLGVELIEQPFAARAYRDLAWLQERSSLPIVADESAVTLEDLDALVGVVAGVNVKLAKCGGIAAAKEMLERASELGFRTFLGCMEETSVGIAASASVASLADWVDLDGCLLLADDPFDGSRTRTPTTAGSCPRDPAWASRARPA